VKHKRPIVVKVGQVSSVAVPCVDVFLVLSFAVPLFQLLMP
jgi:hypothetical protein